ncbi:hypothetical protein [Kinneretia aquatilis]|uniref:hypothetical protein n=1 Tax=Kinneretia aquatilis TaxID=2070761 RepID=UPI00105737FB|nr:hypothetical protein [Paucibacter aquatile]
MVAKTIRERVLTEDLSDPIGVTAIEYRIKVSKVLRGKASRELTVRSENNSTRFPMDVGVSYLLMLNRDLNGKLFVDNCGNSGTLSDRKAERRALEEPVANAKRRPNHSLEPTRVGKPPLAAQLQR